MRRIALALTLALPAAPLVAQIVGIARKAPPAAKADVDPAKLDADALAAAGLKADDPAGVVAYFRQRTLSDQALSQIQAVIRRLGAGKFEDRVKASDEVRRFGPAAIAPLRKAAQSDPDPEVAWRAGEALRRAERVPHAAIAAAGVRALVRAKPAGAVGALIGFLPLADTPAVAEDIRAALVALAARDGKADPALVAALADPDPARRSAAAVALIEGGPGGERIHLPDAYPKVKAMVSGEPDAAVRSRVLAAMLVTARDPDALSALLDGVAELPRGRLWQVEDFLRQLAGGDAPKAIFGKSKESLQKARDEWRAWWEQAKGRTDLAKFEYKPRTAGRLSLLLIDTGGWGNGRIVELDPDLHERSRITGLSGNYDAALLPNGNVVVLEPNAPRVTERDATGRVLGTITLPFPPTGFQVLPNGNVLVAFRNQITEYDRAGKQVQTFTSKESNVVTAARLPNGKTVFVRQNQNQLFTLDDKFTLQEATQRLETGVAWAAKLVPLSDERILLVGNNSTTEYETKTGKVVWKVPVFNAGSVQRLPNGNTLIADQANNRVAEFAPSGEEVWSFTPKDTMRLSRAYLR